MRDEFDQKEKKNIVRVQIMSTTTTNDYLLYLSLVLGSVGAYGALAGIGAPDLDEEEIAVEMSSESGLSSSKLASMLTQLSKKVDQNAGSKAANADAISAILSGSSALRSELDALSASVAKMDNSEAIAAILSGSSALRSDVNSLSTSVSNIENDVTNWESTVMGFERKLILLEGAQKAAVRDSERLPNIEATISAVKSTSIESNRKVVAVEKEQAINFKRVTRFQEDVGALQSTSVASTKKILEIWDNLVALENNLQRRAKGIEDNVALVKSTADSSIKRVSGLEVAHNSVSSAASGQAKVVDQSIANIQSVVAANTNTLIAKNNELEKSVKQLQRETVEIKKLAARLKVVEDNYLDRRKTVNIKNGVAKKYLSSDGKPTAAKNSIHAHYSIEYD